MMDSGTTIKLFGNTNMIKNRQKSETPMNLMTNARSEVVDEVGEINGARQTKLRPQMIANVLSMNKTTKKYRVKFNSGDENGLKVNIGDKIVKLHDVRVNYGYYI